MLGKLLGSSLSILGFTTCILIETRYLDWPLPPYILVGGMGGVLFLGSARWLSKRQVAENKFLGVLSWALLLMVAGLILFTTSFLII